VGVVFVSHDTTITSDGAERHDITIVPAPSEEWCNDRQLVDYREHRKTLIQWVLTFGKDPSRGEGYAFETTRRRAHDLDAFYRWVWDQRGQYTTQPTQGEADEYLRELVYGSTSRSHKRNVQKALKMYFRWRDDCEDWDPEITIGAGGRSRQPREYFTRAERRRLREGALEYGTVPARGSLTGEELQHWEIHLAQRFRTPTEEISAKHFARANGFKIPSLVWVSLDAGLRPIEVGRARTGWVDTENDALRIPPEDAAKSDDAWTVSLRERTGTMLAEWLEERTLYDEYAGTDRLWLTREGNPYSSRSLTYLLGNLCDVADIDDENRQLTWYAIRHSVGTYMTREEGLEAAASQLRHKSVETTRKYDAAPLEDRRNALERME